MFKPASERDVSFKMVLLFSESPCRSEIATDLIRPLPLDLLRAQECTSVSYGLCRLPWGHWLKLGLEDE